MTPFPQSGETICDPTKVEFGTNNGEDEYNTGNMEDSPSIEGLHTGGELPLPPWRTMESKKDSGQWTGLVSSKNSRNRSFVFAKNRIILPQ